jgi:hypothetical protein
LETVSALHIVGALGSVSAETPNAGHPILVFFVTKQKIVTNSQNYKLSTLEELILGKMDEISKLFRF